MGRLLAPSRDRLPAHMVRRRKAHTARPLRATTALRRKGNMDLLRSPAEDRVMVRLPRGRAIMAGRRRVMAHPRATKVVRRERHPPDTVRNGVPIIRANAAS